MPTARRAGKPRSWYGAALPVRVVHMTEFLDELIASGRIRVNEDRRDGDLPRPVPDRAPRRAGSGGAARARGAGLRADRAEGPRRDGLLLRRRWRRGVEPARRAAAAQGLRDEEAAGRGHRRRALRHQLRPVPDHAGDGGEAGAAGTSTPRACSNWWPTIWPIDLQLGRWAWHASGQFAARKLRHDARIRDRATFTPASRSGLRQSTPALGRPSRGVSPAACIASGPAPADTRVAATVARAQPDRLYRVLAFASRHSPSGDRRAGSVLAPEHVLQRRHGAGDDAGHRDERADRQRRQAATGPGRWCSPSR